MKTIIAIASLILSLLSVSAQEPVPQCITNITIHINTNNAAGWWVWIQNATNGSPTLAQINCDTSGGNDSVSTCVFGPCTTASATTVATVSWQCTQTQGCGTGGNFDITVGPNVSGVCFTIYPDGPCSLTYCRNIMSGCQPPQCMR